METNRTANSSEIQEPLSTRTPDIHDGVIAALRNISATLGCSADVREWHWNVSSIIYIGNRATTSMSELANDDVIKIVFFALVSAFAITGNIAVITLVLRSRSLRNPLNYYLVNLAVADVIIASFCAWTYLIEKVTNSPWVLGPIVCKLSGFVQMTALTGSTLTLMAISADRFMAVKYPLRRMHKHCGKIITLIWVAAMSVSSPFLIYRTLVTVKWKDYDENICTDTWPRHAYQTPDGKCFLDGFWKRTYYTIITVAMFFIPLCVMGVTYCLIGVHVWKSQTPGRSELAPSSEAAASADTTRRGTKMKVLRMVMVVMIVFCVCWAPLQFINLYAMWGHELGKNGHFRMWYEVALLLAYCLAYGNSAINPILYGGLNPTFRKTFVKSLSNALRTGQEPERAATRGVVRGVPMRRTTSTSTSAKRAAMLVVTYKADQDQPTVDNVGPLQSNTSPGSPGAKATTIIMYGDAPEKIDEESFQENGLTKSLSFERVSAAAVHASKQRKSDAAYSC